MICTLFHSSPAWDLRIKRVPFFTRSSCYTNLAMKNLLRYALPATVAVTILSFIPLLLVRVIWTDILLLSTGLAGVAVITFIILHKTQILNIQEKFLKDRQNFESLVGSIREYAIFLLDINGLVASWNSGAESIKGFTSVDIIGKPTDLFYKDEDIENGLPQRNLQIALQLGHFETEGWRLRKDRSPFYADIVFTPLYDQQHKHYGYAVVTRDITRRKETEAALVALNNELEDRVIQKTAERIASEEKLSTGEEQFRRTLDNMLEGIQIHDRDWRYVYVNRALAKYAQYSRSELLGFTLMEKYPGIEQTDLFATLQRCMNERLALHFETEFVFPGGIKKDFQLSIQPVPEGLFILSIDITNRKKAEEKLIISEENYRSIMERVSDGFAAIDKNWCLTYVNKMGATILRHTPEELIAKNIWTVFPRAVGKPFHKAYSRAMEEQHYMHLEEYYAHFDVWFENHIYPSPDGISVFFRDITQRKKAEQQREFDQSNLHALINNTTDLMWSVARDFTLITSNQAFEAMVTQLSGAPIIHGDSVLVAAFPAGQLEIFRTFYERAFAGESFTTEHSGFYGDTWSEISFHPVYEGNIVMGTACFSRDITERKIAEGLLKSRLAEKKVVAARMQSILDTIPADIALLNDKGIIIDVNDAWRNGTDSNGFTGNAYKTGDNYLDHSKHVSDEQWKEQKDVAKGLADVLSNKVNEFVHEYDCDDPEIKKCFRMVARPLLGKEFAGAVVIHIDITELRRLERETLAGKIEQQKSITRAMLQAQEKERNHIGLELHDNVSQLLAATRMKLQLAVKGREVNKAVIIECITHVEETMVETRNLSHRMVMPRFADSSFLEAIEGLAVIYRMPSRTIQLEIGGLDENIVSPGIKETLYRIAQEQLNNINKYAQATAIVIRTTTNNDTVTMLVKDNGVGFNTMKKKAGIGLVNIKNRSESYNGSAVVVSAPGNGCCLTIHIPLQNLSLVPCVDALPALIK